MKNLTLIVVLAFAVLLLRSSVSAQDTSAVNVQTSCAHWAKVRVDKHKQFKGDSNDLYQTGRVLIAFASWRSTRSSNQWQVRIARQKLKHDLYDRRFAV